MNRRTKFQYEDTAKRPIKVLYTTHASNLTGASRSLLDMLSGLPEGEVEPTVLLRKHGPIETKLHDMSVPYAVVPHVPWVNSKRGRFPDRFKRLVHRIAQVNVDRFVYEGGFDLVHSNSLLCGAGMVAARRLGIPYVSHIRELVEEGHDMYHLDECLSRVVVHDADKVICISELVERKYSSWCRESSRCVINDGIDVQSYFDIHKTLFDEGVTRLLLAGRFEPGKCQLQAIQAVELLNDMHISVHLILVGGTGDAEYRQECNEYIQNRGLSGCIEILDFVDDVSTLRSEADITLTCSMNEAMGRVTAEGMMAGCLAVALNSGANPELVVHGKTGYLYESNSPAALAQCIRHVLEHREEGRKVALKGQKWACEHFDIDSYGAQILTLYKKILNFDS